MTHNLTIRTISAYTGSRRSAHLTRQSSRTCTHLSVRPGIVRQTAHSAKCLLISQKNDEALLPCWMLLRWEGLLLHVMNPGNTNGSSSYGLRKTFRCIAAFSVANIPMFDLLRNCRHKLRQRSIHGKWICSGLSRCWTVFFRHSDIALERRRLLNNCLLLMLALSLCCTAAARKTIAWSLVPYSQRDVHCTGTASLHFQWRVLYYNLLLTLSEQLRERMRIHNRVSVSSPVLFACA